MDGEQHPPFLQMRGIVKQFPGVLALSGVNFDVRLGEVHVLLGENGAGKSTLIKVLSGVYPPDAGEILLGGRPAAIRNPHDAQLLGVSTIYQELNLVPDMTVAENIFLGREPMRALWHCRSQEVGAPDPRSARYASPADRPAGDSEAAGDRAATNGRDRQGALVQFATHHYG